MAEKLISFHKILKADTPVNETSELRISPNSINKASNNVRELASKQRLFGKRTVVTTDSSFSSGAYALTVRYNQEQKVLSEKKSNAPLAFVWKIFFPYTTQNVNIFDNNFGHTYGTFQGQTIFVPCSETDNLIDREKSIKHIFLAESIPLSL